MVGVLGPVRLIESNDAVEAEPSNFHNVMNDGVTTFIPRKLIKPTNKSKRSCPYSPGLLHKVHLKRIAFKNFKKHPTTNNYDLLGGRFIYVYF